MRVRLLAVTGAVALLLTGIVSPALADDGPYFPPRAFSDNPLIHKKRAERPSRLLRAMSEPRLCTGEWTGRTIYRVLVYHHPAGGKKPLCVRLARIPTGECESRVVVLKHGRADEAGSKPGAIERRRTKRLTARRWADLEAALREEKLLDLPGWDDVERLRGVTCIIEAVNEDRYHAARRWGGRVENRRFNRAARAILEAAGVGRERLCVPDYLDIKDGTIVMVRTLNAWGAFRLHDQDAEEALADGTYRTSNASGIDDARIKERFQIGPFRLRWSGVGKGLGRIHYDSTTGICVTDLDRVKGIHWADLVAEYWVSAFDRLDLGEEHKAQRAEVKALGDIGPEDLPALALLLKHGSGPVRRYVVFALGEIGPDALPLLVDALIYRGPEGVRDEAVSVLSGIGPDAIPALIDALKNEDKPVNVRSGAAKVLGKFGPAAEDAVPALIEALGHTTLELRSRALDALSRIGPKANAAVPALARVLESSTDQGSRCSAAEALGNMGPAAREAVPALIHLLEGTDVSARYYAAKALGKIGPAARDAVPALMRSLKKDKFEGARASAVVALVRINPETEGIRVACVEALKHDRDKWVRSNAIEALGEMAPAAEDLVPLLVQALKDKHPGVRMEAVKALGRIGPAARSAVPVLQAASTDPHRTMRKAVAESLGKIGPAARDAVPALRALLADPERMVRRAAIEAIPRIDPEAELKPPPPPPPDEVF